MKICAVMPIFKRLLHLVPFCSIPPSSVAVWSSHQHPCLPTRLNQFIRAYICLKTERSAKVRVFTYASPLSNLYVCIPSSLVLSMPDPPPTERAQTQRPVENSLKSLLHNTEVKSEMSDTVTSQSQHPTSPSFKDTKKKPHLDKCNKKKRIVGV